MDNFSKTCGAIILLLVLLSAAFGLQAHAEEYDQPAVQTEETTEAPAETGEVIQVQGVQTYDPQLYDRLDKMQESIDALIEALPPSEDAQSATEEVPAQNSAPDYSTQLSTISGQLVDLRMIATAETAEPAFSKSFQDYSVTEILLLVLVAVAVGAVFIGFVRRL